MNPQETFNHVIKTVRQNRYDFTRGEIHLCCRCLGMDAQIASDYTTAYLDTEIAAKRLKEVAPVNDYGARVGNRYYIPC